MNESDSFSINNGPMDQPITESQQRFLNLLELDMSIASRQQLKEFLESNQDARDVYAVISALQVLKAEGRIIQYENSFEKRLNNRLDVLLSEYRQQTCKKFYKICDIPLIGRLKQTSALGWGFAAQSVLILLLVINFYKPPVQLDLMRGSDKIVCYPYLVQFRSDVEFGEIQRILVQSNMRIGVGPNLKGEYELSAPGKNLSQVSEVLKDVGGEINKNIECIEKN